MRTNTSAGLAAICASLVVSLVGCGSAPQPTDERVGSVTARPEAAPSGSDEYASAEPTFAGVTQAPSTPSATPTAAANAEVCKTVGEQVVEYSKFAVSRGDAASSIDKIISFDLVQDLRSVATRPPTGQKEVVINCDARVRWSTGDRSTINMYLLVDSDGNFRVRWDSIRDVVSADGVSAPKISADPVSSPSATKPAVSPSATKPSPSSAPTKASPTPSKSATPSAKPAAHAVFYLETTVGCWSWAPTVQAGYPIGSPNYKTLYKQSCSEPHHMQVIWAGLIPSANPLPTDAEVSAHCSSRYKGMLGHNAPSSVTPGATYLNWFFADPGPEAKNYPRKAICYVFLADDAYQKFSVVSRSLVPGA